MLRFYVCVIGFITSVTLCGYSGYAQQLPGQPHIKELQPSDYPQNWDFTQDSNGIMYVANQGGVVEYDGVEWTPYNTIQRSVYSLSFDNHGNLHVGAEGELGYFKARKPDTSMVPAYVSLIDSLPKKHRKVGNVWQTERKGEWVYYNNMRHIFAFNGDQMNVLTSSTTFRFIQSAHNVLYVQSKNDAIFRLENGTLVRDELLSKHFSDDNLALILPADIGSLLVITKENKFYTINEQQITAYDPKPNEIFENVRIYRGIRLRDGSYVLGTLGQGLFRMAKDGSIISLINTKTGLSDDMVFNVFQSNDGLVWAALNEGVATIEVHSPIRRANEVNNLEGMVVDIVRMGNNLFVATTSGLYKTVVGSVTLKADKQFAKILATEDVNNILPISNSKMLYSTREGMYVYDLEQGDGQNLKISALPGVKAMLRDGTRLRFYAGNANGIYQLIADSSFQSVRQSKIISLQSPVTNMVLAGNTLWSGTLLDGAKKIDLQTSRVDTYEVPHRDLTKSVKVAQIRDSVYIAGTTGLYVVNNKGNVIRSTIFGDFSADSTRQFFIVKEDRQENVWIRSDRVHQVARLKNDGSYSIEQKWLSRITDGQINVIYPDPYNPGLVWMGGDGGLISYNSFKDPLTESDNLPKSSALIRGVKINGDSLVANEYSSPKTFHYKHRNLRFMYAAPDFLKPELTQYQVLLDGFDAGWSAWTHETQKDYTNITEGTYTFKVRAKDLFGRVTNTAGYTFIVNPPWFRTWWAYSLYVLVIGLIAYGVHMWRVKRLLHIYKLRNSIARDLHDEVSATLSSISFFASAAKMDNTPEEGKKFINLIEQSSSDAKEKINDIIWSIDPEKDSWSLFVAKCRRYAADLFESRGIDYDINMVSEYDISLDLKLRQNLWLIFKEMVTNAARHSKASFVEISCRQAAGNKLTLVIKDNGQGMEEPDNHSGNGINNINKRAEEIGADVVLTTEPGDGTCWKLKISE